MDKERIEFIPKRNMVRETMRWVAECLHLDLYFAQRQRYDEIKAVFIDQYDRHHSILVKLNEVGDRYELFDNLRSYFEDKGGNGRDLDGGLVMKNYILHNMDVASLYPTEEVLEYCKNDVDVTTRLYKRMLNYQYGYKPITPSYFKIEKVIFNDPATIVIWADGSKTVVKCQPGDTFDKEKGLAMAISKRALGDKGRYCEEFKKWIPAVEEEVKIINSEEIVGPYADAMKAMKNLEKAFKKCNVTIPELKIEYPKNLFGLKNVNTK